MGAKRADRGGDDVDDHAERAAAGGGPTGRSSGRRRAGRAPCPARQAVSVSWTVAAGACRASVTSRQRREVHVHGERRQGGEPAEDEGDEEAGAALRRASAAPGPLAGGGGACGAPGRRRGAGVRAVTACRSGRSVACARWARLPPLSGILVSMSLNPLSMLSARPEWSRPFRCGLRMAGDERGRVRWGVLATGGIAATFTADLLALPGAEVVAVASRTRPRRRRSPTVRDTRGRTASWAELVADDEVDVVYVATPHSAHRAAAGLVPGGRASTCCARRRSRSTRGRRRNWSALARDRGLFLMEAMWMYCNPVVRRLTELVAGRRDRRDPHRAGRLRPRGPLRPRPPAARPGAGRRRAAGPRGLPGVVRPAAAGRAGPDPGRRAALPGGRRPEHRDAAGLGVGRHGAALPAPSSADTPDGGLGHRHRGPDRLPARLLPPGPLRPAPRRPRPGGVHRGPGPRACAACSTRRPR